MSNIQQQQLPIASIRIDGGTQSRVEINEQTVAEYADAILGGAVLPPVTVFFDGVAYWLADGFHRFHATTSKSIAAEVRTGTQRDARLFSFGANHSHGLRRSNADKHKSVSGMLSDAEWGKWSQEKIAVACGVSAGFVSKLVNELASLHGEEIKPPVRTVERNGKTYEQNTANIGRAGIAAPETKSTQHPGPTAGFSSPDEPSDSRLRGEFEDLKERFDEQGRNLAEAIADNDSMARVFEADDKVVAALAEAKRFREMNRILEERLRGVMGEANEAKRYAKSYQRRAEKAEKRLKELESKD